MHGRFTRRTGEGAGDDGSRPPALAAVELERPRLRTRPDPNGRQPHQRRPHRLLQPLPLAALLLILLALIGYWSVYSRTTRRTPVLVAAHALPAGRVLRTSDLAHSGLAGSSQLLATLLPASDQGLLVGRSLKESVAAGAPIPQSALASARGGTDSITLAVPVQHALGGQLAPGDRVTVLATRPPARKRIRRGCSDPEREHAMSDDDHPSYTSATGQAQTRAIARNLEVLSVGSATGFNASAQTIPVTVSLSNPSVASALALANEAGKLAPAVERKRDRRGLR